MRARSLKPGVWAGLAALAVVMLLAPLPALAASEGVVYLPPRVDGRATLSVPILENYALQVPAGTDSNADGVIDTPGTASIDLSQYLPQGLSPDAIRVFVKDASGSVTVKALDSSGATLAQADVVPLSSGYEVTFPGTTVTLGFENLASQVWQGTITVVVESTIDIDLEFKVNQVNITNGYGEAPAEVVVYSAPQGYVRLLEYDPNPSDSISILSLFDVTFKGNYGRVDIPAHSDPQNPLRIPATVAITASAPAGTYDVGVRMYFYDSVTQTEVEVADLSLTVSLSGDASGTAEVSQEESEGFNWKAFGIGAVAVVAVLLLITRFAR